MLTRTTHIAIEVLGALALGLAIIVAGLGWRLSQGPLSLDFLKPYLEQALQDSSSPFRLTVGEPELIWSGWNRPIDLRATDVTLLDRQGAVLATVPQMSLKLSLRALARGMVAPTSIALLGARATMIRTADGHYRLALGPPSAAGGDMLARFAAVLLAPPDPTRSLGYLRRISITGARLDVEDRQLGLAWTAPRADVVFARGARGIRVAGDLEVDLGGSVAHLSATGTYRRADETTNAELHFSGVRPASLAARFPPLAALAPVELPLAGTLDATFDQGGRIVSGKFDVTAGAGEVVAPELWRIPLDVSGAHAKGTLSRGPDRITVEEGSVTLGGGPRLRFSGTAIRDGGATEAKGTVTLADVPFGSLAHYWPAGIAVGARRWITANMADGRLTEGHAALALRLGASHDAIALESMSGGFRISGATVHYLRPLPPVTGVAASGTFDTNSVTITGTAGRLAGISLDQSTVKFTHIERKIADASVEVVARGPLRDALELLDNPRFRYAHKLGIDPKGVTGVTAARLAVTFPTARALKFKDVGIRAAANLRGVALKKAVFGQDLSDGNLVLRLDRGGMDVSGKARVAGVPSDIVWVENFDPKSPIARRYQLKAQLDDADRARLGLSTKPFATGPMNVDLALIQPVRGPTQLQVRLGLDKATLALPVFGWSKPAGKPGTATVVGTLVDGKPVELSRVGIDAGGLDAAGWIAFGADGATIARAEIDRFHLGGTDLRGTIARRPDGGYDASLGGGTLDSAPLIRHIQALDGETGALPPLKIAVRLDRLKLLAGPPLTAVSGALDYNGTRWTNAALDARLAGGHRVTLHYGPVPRGTRLLLDSKDAGKTLQVLGIYDNIRGGRLRLEGERPTKPGATWTGMLRMENFRAVKAPTLARVLTVASLTGIGNLVSGEGITFARLMMPFTYKDGRMVIDNARAAGSEIGITAEGTLDLDRDTVKINGTIVPAYTINSVLGNVPLLGKLLTGEKGSGVFAATYHLDGKLEEPTVQVNPLAALAPGFLRDLVDGLMRGGGTNVPMPMPQNIP